MNNTRIPPSVNIYFSGKIFKTHCIQLKNIGLNKYKFPMKKSHNHLFYKKHLVLFID